MNDILRHILRFLIIMAMQLLLFEGLDLGTHLYPMPYILFILLFPCTASPAVLMIWAFVFGLGLDFLSTGIAGLHTAAFVMTAALRNTFLKVVIVKGDFDNLSVPGFTLLGFSRYTFFVFLCVLTHHTTYFILESFSFFLFWQSLARFSASLLLNVFLILLFKKTFFERVK